MNDRIRRLGIKVDLRNPDTLQNSILIAGQSISTTSKSIVPIRATVGKWGCPEEAGMSGEELARSLNARRIGNR
jgi:hypothetical protein